MNAYLAASDPRVSHVVDLLTAAVFAAWQEGTVSGKWLAGDVDDTERQAASDKAAAAQTKVQKAIYTLANALVAEDVAP